MSYSSDDSSPSPSISRSASGSSTPSSTSEYQLPKAFLLSPALLDVNFLTNFARELSKGFGDRIVIPVDHLDTSPVGWVQHAIKSLPAVDLEGKHWEKHIAQGTTHL